MATKTSDWTGLTVSDGRYRITSKLGEGGMGVVYRALDTRLGMDVVIKVPRPSMFDEPEFAGRFESEIRSLVRLSHPAIVKVTDVGQYEDLPFAVLQYLPGGTLEARLHAHPRGGPRAAADFKTALGWLRGVATALDYIHSQGYIHRDVKPGNILFDDQGHAFLGDFGVIKALAAAEKSRAQAVTGAGLVLGTPEYMAPEMIMGAAVDGCADQYALAVAVYEALCGRRPFEGATATAVLVLHSTQAPPPPSALRPELPEGVSRAVLKGLAKDPSQRHANCVALAEAVAAALVSSPVAAAGALPPELARPESVTIVCSACGKKIAMAVSTYSTLKRKGKSFACPNCQQPVEVASPRTQVLSAPAPDPGIAPTGTRKLPAMEPAAIPGQRPPGDHPRATEKIETPIRAPAHPAQPRSGNRVKTQVLGRDRTQILPQESRSPEPHRVAPTRWRLAWIGAGVTASLLLIGALVFGVLPQGRQKAGVPGGAQATAAPEVAARGKGDYPFRPLVATHVDPPPEEATPAREENPEGASPSRVPAPPVPPSPVVDAAPPAPPQPEPPEIVVAATRDSAAVPSPVAPSTSDEASPDAGPPGLSGDPQRFARGTAARRGDPPSLEALLAAPERFANQEIAPKGLFRLADRVSYASDGTPSIAIVEGGLGVKLGGPQMFEVVPLEDGKITNVVVERGLADRLIAKGISHRGAAASATGGVWQKNVAILTFGVLRSSGMAQGSRGVCRLVRAEFLTNLDFVLIGQDRFKRSFQTLLLSADGERLGAGDGEEWKDRVGLHFTNTIKRMYRTLRHEQSQAKWAAFNMQMGALLQATVERASAAEAAAEAARRRAVMGK
jgi:serine/threonine-protein kinase